MEQFHVRGLHLFHPATLSTHSLQITVVGSAQLLIIFVEFILYRGVERRDVPKQHAPPREPCHTARSARSERYCFCGPDEKGRNHHPRLNVRPDTRVLWCYSGSAPRRGLYPTETASEVHALRSYVRTAPPLAGASRRAPTGCGRFHG